MAFHASITGQGRIFLLWKLERQETKRMIAMAFHIETEVAFFSFKIYNIGILDIILLKVVVVMPVNRNELTKEMVIKALQCRDADELIVLAKTGGIELTKEEAETYMAELADFELDGENLKKVSGGIFECYMRNDCMYAFDDWK